MNRDGNTAQCAGGFQPDCPSHPLGDSNNKKLIPKSAVGQNLNSYNY